MNTTLPPYVRRRLAGTRILGTAKSDPFDYGLSAVERRRKAGQLARRRGFGVKCRRCREYLPMEWVDDTRVCNICQFELADERGQAYEEERRRYGLPD